jgi:Ca2+-binding RTX toxin-like protein
MALGPGKQKVLFMTAPTDNADFLVGDDSTNVIFGLGGNDAIFGLGGDDLLVGDAGRDLLVGGRGDDTLNGGTGFDTANYNDDIAAITANLFTGVVTRTVNGIDETDTLLSIEGLTGGGGDDVLDGNDVANALQGNAGDDGLFGKDGADKLFGGEGRDYLEGGAGADLLSGGADIDTASYVSSTAGVHVNLLTGTGSGGDAAGDVLTGIERLIGSIHNDNLTGNGVDNLLEGGAGDDTLNGDDGDDQMFGGTGADHLIGGNGIDSAIFSGTVAEGVQIDLASGTGAGGDAEGDVITGVENISGTVGADKLLGNNADNVFSGGGGDDTLSGRGGADTLWGYDGNDILNGGAGDDNLGGGAGQDVMTGGAGNDTYRFEAFSESGTTALTRDLIKDFFVSGNDLLNLHLLDANSLLANNQDFNFIGTAGFSGAAGELHAVASGANTIVEGDVNGDKVADFQIEFTGHLTFALGDFVL